MPLLLSLEARRRLKPPEAMPALPVPARIVSNGEFTPPLQSAALAADEHRRVDLVRERSQAHALTAPEFLRRPVGMATAFGALNDRFGTHFAVAAGEAETIDEAARQRDALAG